MISLINNITYRRKRPNDVYFAGKTLINHTSSRAGTRHQFQAFNGVFCIFCNYWRRWRCARCSQIQSQWPALNLLKTLHHICKEQG